MAPLTFEAMEMKKISQETVCKVNFSVSVIISNIVGTYVLRCQKLSSSIIEN